VGLLEGEPEVLERHDPVQLPELVGCVAAVTGSRIDLGRVEQPDLVVVPQRANGHRSQSGELADTEHG